MIALPAAFLRIGQFDVDYEVLLPDSTQYVSASPEPGAIVDVQGANSSGGGSRT